MNATAQFHDAIQAAGLTPPDVIEADGKLHRFTSNGERGDDAGWYLLHGDGIPAGSFGDWRTGFSQTWRADIGRAMTHDEESAHRAKVKLMLGEREADDVRRKAEMVNETERADFDTLPTEMRKAPRWLVWKSIKNPDPSKKPRKVPYYVNGVKRNGAMDTPEDVARLGTFEQALGALATGKYTGLGFALGDDGTGNFWQGIDLDHLSEHPENHCLRDNLIGMTYCETSPNGDGIHAIGYGRHFESMGSTADGLEAYSSGRFFTVTGDEL